MQNLSTYLNKFYSDTNLAEAKTRRQNLITEMAELESDSKDCSNCTGLCCTFIANSMQTDAIQTIEIYEELQRTNRFTTELISELESSVRSNRLDNEISTGKNSTFRRTYTCPFLVKGPQGCSLSRTIKPYGCLGFNPESSKISETGHCSSNVNLLKVRDDEFSLKEENANNILKKDLNLDWDKYPMPLALLKMHKAIGDYFNS